MANSPLSLILGIFLKLETMFFALFLLVEGN